MKLKKFFLLVVIIILCIDLNAQSCRGSSPSKFYFTPYLGIGNDNYKLSIDNAIINGENAVYLTENTNVFNSFAGLNFMFNVGNANIGFGGEYQNYNGRIDFLDFDDNINLYSYRLYLRSEILLYRDAFNDIGIFFEGGTNINNEYIGKNSSLGPNANFGMYYNLVINSVSSLMFNVHYNYTSFNTKYLDGDMNHLLKGFRFSLGYRMWKKNY